MELLIDLLVLLIILSVGLVLPVLMIVIGVALVVTLSARWSGEGLLKKPSNKPKDPTDSPPA